jgi:hypothetical protein
MKWAMEKALAEVGVVGTGAVKVDEGARMAGGRVMSRR